ncbi:MAG: class I SAM-dependent methyltransferase [Acidimicrobiales bacterium]
MSTHWFEPIAEHLGSAYLRYSFTKGTEQEVAFLVQVLGLDGADGSRRVLDVGCGPGRHLRALQQRGLEVVGVDIAAPFVRLAGPTAARGDARRLPVRSASVDAAISLCQGGFGLPEPDRAFEDDRAVLTEMARVVRPGGRLALSAFSAYFQVRHLEADRDTFNAATGVNHEHTEIRSETGAVAPTELWTACYTPRELRLLAALVGLETEAVWSVTPGGYEARTPTVDSHEFLLVARRPH